MKTAISVPDDVFARVDAAAREDGVSRSEFFANAARAFLEQRSQGMLERRIDHALASLDEPPDDRAFVRASGRRALAVDDW